MANYYAQAIDILESDINFRKLVVQIAKKHPKAVVDAYQLVALGGFTPGSWEVRALPLIKAGKKLEAIKVCKTVTGETLAKAKEMVEQLMEQLK